MPGFREARGMPAPPTRHRRRVLLGGLTSAGLALLPGCGMLSDDIHATVTVHNQRESAIAGRLHVLHDAMEETVFDRDVELAPSEETPAFDVQAPEKLRLELNLADGDERIAYWNGSCTDAALRFVVNGPDAIAYKAPACD